VVSEIFSLQGVDFGYSGKGKLFRGLDFCIEDPGFILFQGPSGSGKTSLLKLLNRLYDPDGGEILYRGKPIFSYDPVLLRQQVAYIPQIPVMVEGSVEDNILLPYRFAINRKRMAPSRDAIKKYMERFLLDGIGLGDRATRLSVGEQQRISLIRGLFLEPVVYLLDEPVSALDESSRDRVERFLAEEHTVRGVTMVMVSHLRHNFEGVIPECYRLSGGTLTGEKQ
jgi:putative ABC transport system ATP-binding protein